MTAQLDQWFLQESIKEKRAWHPNQQFVIFYCWRAKSQDPWLGPVTNLTVDIFQNCGFSVRVLPIQVNII